MMHFHTLKKKIFNNIALNSYKMYSLWYLHHTFIILWGQKIFKRHILLPRINDKLVLFPTEGIFDTSEENQLSYFQNAFFSKVFGDTMSQIIR